MKNILITMICFCFLGMVQASEETCTDIKLDVVENNFTLLCDACHTNLPTAPKFKTGDRLDKTDEELKNSIMNGLNAMPPRKGFLKPEEIDEILCYIRTLEEQ